MANTNFTVHNGLTVGSTTIDATSSVINAGGNIIAASGTNTTTTTSGALVVSGGAGISGNIYLGSNVFAGTLSYTDTNIKFIGQQNYNGYVQSILQNTNNGSTASSDFIVNNDQSTASTYYGDFGINSSGFSGSGSLNASNNVYLTATSSDLVLGTTTNNAIRFVINGGTTDSVIIGTSGNLVVTTATNSTSATTGSIVTAGGIGVAQDAYIGGKLYVGGNTTFINTTIINTTDTLSAPTIIAGSGGVYPNANASVNLGTTSAYWNNVYAVNFLGTSTTAKYADLAERYTSDANYEPGTVVDFGGDAEVTLSNIDSSPSVAGVVSTNPAYMMNSDGDGLYIALVGRVPTKVTGPVRKGQMMVSNGDGTARGENNPIMGGVIGKALENFSDGVGVIEVVVGRL
jgi:hypothetical protein